MRVFWGVIGSGLKKEDKLQFERVGFFMVDYDSDTSKNILVFNRSVALQDKSKQKVLSSSGNAGNAGKKTAPKK
jgi:hypothetical protein